MCGFQAAQIHEWSFRAAKEPVQPLTALDSFLPYGKKIWILAGLSSMSNGVYWEADHFGLLMHTLWVRSFIRFYINIYLKYSTQIMSLPHLSGGYTIIYILTHHKAYQYGNIDYNFGGIFGNIISVAFCMPNCALNFIYNDR